ncbi:hypothetical protein BT67DRAFT_368959 [Trichocladium antarcticum]|uniref:Uncharacterized protein n=1 Tax=Trichocladium antarcticum TaxID=1450529 RepID=A0AAN6UUN3_9PEZI|nr:hypothetical protein BT67DRAFT_368959 [Trichocladium antarcticum]
MDATTPPGLVDSRLRLFSEALDSLRPSRARSDRELPVTMSSFRRYLPQIRASLWESRCSHSTMTTIYHETSRCDHCRRQGHFGWLYCCTIDTDPLILGAKASGASIAFDNLGSRFAENMTLGKFGPDARSRKLSLFSEMSAEQMHTYTPQQIATVLAQRENVHTTIAKERNQATHSVRSARRNFPDDNRPWMPDKRYECRHTVCHRCHHNGRDKSWVSLNGVLEGDVLPNVAVGLSFRYMGARPCVDARVVRNIGYRAVPLVRIPNPSFGSCSHPSSPMITRQELGQTGVPQSRG